MPSSHRSSSDLDTVARVDVCVARNRRTALDAAKTWMALPLWSSYPNWDYLEPLHLVVPARVRDILATRDYGRIQEAGTLIPDAFAEHLVVAGTLDDVVEQMQAIAGTGVTQITIHPTPVEGQEERDVLELFGKHVMPALRAPGGGAG